MNKNGFQNLETNEHDIPSKLNIDSMNMIFNNNSSVYLLVNQSGKVVSINKKGKEVLGYKSSDLIGNSIFNIVYKTEYKKILNKLNKLADNGCDGLEWKIKLVTSDKQPIHFKQIATKTITADNQVLYVIAHQNIEHEIAHRKQIIKQYQELKAEKNKSLSANVEKQQFASIMSHEIRTPLNAVIGMTNLMMIENPKPEQIENLNVIKFAAENLMSIVNDILDYSKIEAGKISLKEVPFNFLKLVKDIYVTHKYYAIEKHLELRLNISNDIPETVIGDPVRLMQILNNLISNAIKFTEKGFVSIQILKNEMNESNQLSLQFKIGDSGIGIEESKQQLIFECFSQAENSNSRKFDGAGIGLAITQKLIAMHNSKIELKSELGVGSEFTFDLQLKLNEANFSPTEIIVNAKNHSLDGAKILLVEDNMFNQLIATKFLEKWNIKVDTAMNGKIALEKMKINHYDIVLMDIQMPEMNGIEATKHIRESEDLLTRNVPVIALTAAALDGENNELSGCGLTDYISKPFNPNELHDKLLHYFFNAEKYIA
jgi:PAS domain S-box-containing protein